MKASNLNTKDLMVGDWVKLSKGNWSENRHVELIDIEMVAEGVYLAEPIPITTEILEKNGFSDNYAEYDLSYAADAGGDIIGVHIVGKGGIMDEMYFDYVHQLQHALRLCKIEKKIEL